MRVERGVDVSVGRRGLDREQRGRSHDLSRLAVAALRHLLGDPRLLQGVRFGWESPSIVVTDFFAAALMVVRQERVGWPSTWTAQAEHCPMPQPYLVPVSPSVSRSTHSSGVSGLMSTVRGVPFTVRENWVTGDLAVGRDSNKNLRTRSYLSRYFRAPPNQVIRSE